MHLKTIDIFLRYILCIHWQFLQRKSTCRVGKKYMLLIKYRSEIQVSRCVSGVEMTSTTGVQQHTHNSKLMHQKPTSFGRVLSCTTLCARGRPSATGRLSCITVFAIINRLLLVPVVCIYVSSSWAIRAPIVDGSSTTVLSVGTRIATGPQAILILARHTIRASHPWR